MLDKIVKYINMSEKKYVWGQKADGTWYCKEFKTDTIDEASVEINSINVLLNNVNMGKMDKKRPVKKNNKIVLEKKTSSDVRME